MRGKNFMYVLMAFIVIFTIAGCGTAPKKITEEVTGIKTRVDTLESRVEGVEMKQSEIERMASEQAQKLDEMKAEREKRIRTNIGLKRKSQSKERIKEIQLLLRNAGFYAGEIDGIKGKGTRKAIREFQKANGLAPDGIVGPKTLEALNRYASAMKEASPDISQEGAK